MRHKFWVSWTYIGNYSDRPQVVEACDEMEAVRLLFASYSDEFRAKAMFYVTSEAPTMLHGTAVWPKPAEDAS